MNSCLVVLFCRSRKELRSKETKQSNFILYGSGNLTPSARIDPSKVVQLSWQPRSGILIRGVVDIALRLSFSEYSYCNATREEYDILQGTEI